jgi:hypothetical protein
MVFGQMRGDGSKSAVKANEQKEDSVAHSIHGRLGDP